MTGWLTDWLASWWTDWPTDWHADRLTDPLTDILTDWHPYMLIDWQVEWLTCGLDMWTDWLTYWLACWWTDWRTQWLFDWLTDWLTYWPTDWLTDWLTILTHWLTVQLADSLTDWLADWHTWLNDVELICRLFEGLLKLIHCDLLKDWQADSTVGGWLNLGLSLELKAFSLTQWMTRGLTLLSWFKLIWGVHPNHVLNFSKFEIRKQNYFRFCLNCGYWWSTGLPNGENQLI